MNVSQRYNQTEVSGMGQIELESRALIRTASQLNSIKDNWDTMQGDLVEALEKNRRLWTVLASAMQEKECQQSDDIKKNIMTLALFVFQRTVDIMLNPKPESLGVLISINMNIAKGLGETEGMKD